MAVRRLVVDELRSHAPAPVVSEQMGNGFRRLMYTEEVDRVLRRHEANLRAVQRSHQSM